MGFCNKQNCPTAAIDIRSLCSSYEEYCGRVTKDEANCEGCPCYFCSNGKVESFITPALSGFCKAEVGNLQD